MLRSYLRKNTGLKANFQLFARNFQNVDKRLLQMASPPAIRLRNQAKIVNRLVQALELSMKVLIIRRIANLKIIRSKNPKIIDPGIPEDPRIKKIILKCTLLKKSLLKIGPITIIRIQITMDL